MVDKGVFQVPPHWRLLRKLLMISLGEQDSVRGSIFVFFGWSSLKVETLLFVSIVMVNLMST